MQRLTLAVMLAMSLLAGCAGAPSRTPSQSQAPARTSTPIATPALRLAPAAFGREVALQQRLTFRVEGRRNVLDAMLEIDAGELRLALVSAGQIALRLHWDGRTLNEVRADWLPAALTGERVLSDLQLVYWPAASVRAALPAGWHLLERDGARELRSPQALVARVDYGGELDARLEHVGAGYELRVQSQAAAR